jgi:RimJ/RimL family protein N-acetyltransferase
LLNPLFPIHTERLILRPFQEEDILPFSQYRSDPEVARYQGWETPFSLAQAAEFVAVNLVTPPGEPGKWFQVAIELKATRELIGDCAFQRLPEDSAQAEIGFTLARPFQGHGYAAEAVRCLVDCLFHHFGLHRIRANCDPANLASIHLLQKVGMRHEGRWIESLWLKGAWVSEDWYALLRSEWQSPQ